MAERVSITARRSIDLRRVWSLMLMGASGFAGLGYQIVWTQQAALWLGHESAAVLAVVAGFFAGLAVGALGLGGRIERSAHPVRWYAACEASIAAWSLVLLFAMAPVGAWMLARTGVQPGALWQWTVAFVGTFVILLPATAAMGVTLPAIERVMSHGASRDRSLAGYYAANTLGATLGVLGAAFWLVPSFGLRATAAICIVLNVCCAMGASMLTSTDAPIASKVASASKASSRRLSIVLACTGLLGIGYEVLIVRVLSQVCEDTVYTFALLLAVYLLGTAGGAAAYQRGVARRSDADDVVIDRLLSALAIACLLSAGSLWFAESVRDVVTTGLGEGVGAAIAAEAVLAAIGFVLPTWVMGALFSHLAASAHRAGIAFGRSLGINIVGAACAPPFFGVVLAPLLGAKLSLLLVVAGYLAMTTRRGWARPAAWGAAAVAAAIAIGAPPLAFIDIPDGGHVVSYREGVLAAVSVVEDGDGVSRLRIDNREQEGSSATRLVDGRQALLPLLLHSAPRRALFLGLGTGVTASTAAELPGVDVDAVELLPEVIAASDDFRSPEGDSVRLRLRQADARRYVRTSSATYDVIVADNFHPARSGSGSLYTVEHFRAVRERLADRGLFCQWLPLHQLDFDTLRSIVRSFAAVFPDGRAMLASNSLGTPVIGLVGRRDGERFDPVEIRNHLSKVGLAHTAAFGIDDVYALLGSFVAGPDALHRFAADARLNTDDLPVVAYRAPRFTYAPDSAPDDRLLAFLGANSIRPDELLVASADPDVARRLVAYWRARNRFIATGRGIRPSSDVRTMLAQVRDPLLAVLQISPDFRPAYDPLLRMAAALGTSDRDAAAALLREVARLQPDRAEAGTLLRRLGEGIEP